MYYYIPIKFQYTSSHLHILYILSPIYTVPIYTIRLIYLVHIGTLYMQHLLFICCMNKKVSLQARNVYAHKYYHKCQTKVAFGIQSMFLDTFLEDAK